MKIVVDVPDEEYESYALAITFGMGNTAIRRILNGTPLPKGHGRLIEANEELFQAIRKYCGKDATFEVFEHAPTIIEADKVCTYKETGCGSCRWQIECPYDEADEKGAEE